MIIIDKKKIDGNEIVLTNSKKGLKIFINNKEVESFGEWLVPALNRFDQLTKRRKA